SDRSSSTSVNHETEPARSRPGSAPTNRSAHCTAWRRRAARVPRCLSPGESKCCGFPCAPILSRPESLHDELAILISREFLARVREGAVRVLADDAPPEGLRRDIGRHLAD